MERLDLPQTYRRRQRAAAGAVGDVFQYESCPRKLRIQIQQTLQEGIGRWKSSIRPPTPAPTVLWERLCAEMRKEEGVNKLAEGRNAEQELLAWMLVTPDIDAFVEALELAMQLIDGTVRARSSVFSAHTTKRPDAVLAEINGRMREAGFGYSYVNGEIVRIDSLLGHQEIVIPALRLTNNDAFRTANEEYMRAHKAFREADFETCLTECAKAFESVLKIIGDLRGWNIQPNDTSQKLIEAAVQAGFLQSFIQAGFTSLRSMLETGVPTVRNRIAAHGAGTVQRIVPEELAAFQLHQTAAAMIFLIETHQAQP